MTPNERGRTSSWRTYALLGALVVIGVVAFIEVEKIGKSDAKVATDERFGHTALRFRLAPGEVREATAYVEVGQIIRYFWSADGGSVLFETHGPDGELVGHDNGEATGTEGVLKAAARGQHHWRWSNRSGRVVTVTVEATGRFSSFGLYR
ncbi:MAG: hypothetical protein ACOY5R_01065 [Pseudomonadota bacterium]